MTFNDRATAGVFVLAAILFQAFWLGLPAIMLSIGMVITYAVWAAGGWTYHPKIRAVYGIGCLVFLVHFTEEYLTGLHHAGPAFFGRESWTGFQFLFFNGVWFCVFALSWLFLRTDRAIALFILFFFALIGGAANGVIHVGLALNASGYFPGLRTAPFCLVVGIWMLREFYTRDAACV